MPRPPKSPITSAPPTVNGTNVTQSNTPVQRAVAASSQTPPPPAKAAMPKKRAPKGLGHPKPPGGSRGVL